MKKIFLCLLILVMSFVMFACDNGNGSATVWNEQLIKDGVIKVGISPDYPPYENLDPDTGKMVGFDLDMIDWLFAGLEGYEVELVQIEFDNIISALQQGQIDYGISGFTYDSERDVLFSDAYLKSAQVAMVKPNSGINSVADLAGKKVGAQLGTTGENCANDIEGVKEVVPFVDATIGMQSVVSGNIDCFVLDEAVAKNFAEANGLVVLEEKLLDEENMIIVKKGNNLLLDKINELIAKYKNSEDYEVAVATWGLN